MAWSPSPPDRVGEDGRSEAYQQPRPDCGFAEALARAKFANVLSRGGQTVDFVLAEMQALVETVHPAPLPEPVCRDPDDDEVLACALTARADLIVSGDLDLLALQRYEAMAIVDAVRALERIAASRSA